MKELTEKKLMPILIFFFVVFSMIGIIGEAAAKTLYVDVNSMGGSCSDSTTYAANDAKHPFCTIQRAADIVNAGDTVLVKDGTYVDVDGNDIIVRLSRGGSAGNFITFKSENPHGAVLDGENNKTDLGFYFVNTNTNYIKIEDFEIKGTGENGISLTGGSYAIHDITIKGNLIHDIRRRFYADGIYGAGAIDGNGYNWIIDSNILHTNGRLHHSPPYPTDTNQDHGVYLSGLNNIIKNNTFYNHISGWSIHYKGTETTNLQILNNTFSDPNPYVTGQIIMWQIQNGTVIIGNTFTNPRNAAIYCYNHSSGTVKMRNNIVSTGENLLAASCNKNLFTIFYTFSSPNPPLLVE